MRSSNLQEYVTGIELQPIRRTIGDIELHQLFNGPAREQIFHAVLQTQSEFRQHSGLDRSNVFDGDVRLRDGDSHVTNVPLEFGKRFQIWNSPGTRPS